MVKRQRSDTPPASDDEEPQPKLKLVDYSDTESDEDTIRPPAWKRRAMTIYSDEEGEEDLSSYFTIKTVNDKKNPDCFVLKGKSFSSTSRLSQKMFRHYSLYLEYLINW